MNQITELPEPTSYGHDFNYAQWTANTRITLCNVPWSNSYRDIVRFAGGHADLDNFIDSQVNTNISIPSATYHRPGHPIRLNVPYGKALGYNYLRAYNPPQPGQPGDVGQTYYYFIGGVNYLNPSTTEFGLQLDVIQSYLYKVEFGNCYIQQGHIGVANENQFLDYGREYLTIPEGMDIGSDYQISKVMPRSIGSSRTSGSGFNIMVISTVALDEDPGDIDNPKFKTATGNFLENLPNGAESYWFRTVGAFSDFLDAYKDKPWITQGIISIMAIPGNSTTDYGMETTDKAIQGMTIREINGGSLKRHMEDIAPDFRERQRERLPAKYRRLSKFLVYPYTVVELTANTGTPIPLKPELIPSAGIPVVEVPHFAQPSPRIMFYPYRYNAGTSSAPVTSADGVVHDGGEFMDMATGIFNFPTFSLVNNSYMSFIASNVNSLAYQHSSADWSQQRALAGNQVGYNQASSNIGTSQDIMGIGVDASRQSTNLANETAVLRGVQSATSGALNSLGAGNPAGAASSIGNSFAGTAIGIHQNEGSFNIGASAARRTNAAATGNMAYQRDTNKDYADFASRGDYSNTIAGINAKVQDAQLIQPTTAGQVGGEAFMLSQYQWGYDLKVKTIHPGAMSRIGDYWLRYGYAVQKFGTPPADLHCMTAFTFWKLSETYLDGSIPENFKEAIRGIFEKGVTVWKSAHLIGHIDIDANYPLEGIRV